MTCKIDFGCNNFLQRHYRIEHYQCKGCSKMFSLEGLKTHYLLDPLCKLIATDVPCEICGCGLTNQNRLSHYKVHEDRLNPLKCFFCLENSKFPTCDMVLHHMRQHHNWPKYFTCGHCQTSLQDRLNPEPKFQRAYYLFSCYQKIIQEFLDHLKTCWTPLMDNQSEDEQVELDLGEIFNFTKMGYWFLLNRVVSSLWLMTSSKMVGLKGRRLGVRMKCQTCSFANPNKGEFQNSTKPGRFLSCPL